MIISFYFILFYFKNVCRGQRFSFKLEKLNSLDVIPIFGWSRGASKFQYR